VSPEAVEEAANIAYRVANAAEDRPLKMCEFTEGVHALLTRLARESSWLEAIGLRAAAGAVTKLRRKLRCINTEV
jgi:hypothetical protein